MLEAYSKKEGIDPATVRFLFDGKRLGAEQTPAEVQASSLAYFLFFGVVQLEMEADDVIDAMVLLLLLLL